MSKKLTSISDLNEIMYRRWSTLDEVDSKYLNDAGIAAKEAYRAVIWHLAFHDSLDSLRSDEEFMNLINISGKDYEYYKILRMVYRALEDALV